VAADPRNRNLPAPRPSLFGAFVVGGRIGNAMTRFVASKGGAPAPPERINARMNYPYRNIWADLATGRAQRLTQGYWPTCPLLFIYGEQKPVRFHSQRWLDHVRKVGGEVIGLPCGHWVMDEPSFIGLLERWLAETGTRLPGAARA
jgi:pimeloyl-ACP methyl ester carboxylesterase